MQSVGLKFHINVRFNDLIYKWRDTYIHLYKLEQVFAFVVISYLVKSDSFMIEIITDYHNKPYVMNNHNKTIITL